MHPLWGTYPETILRFPDAGLRIDLRRPVPPEAIRALAGLGLTGPFAVVTACEPLGQRLEDAANSRLTTVLTSLVLERYPSARLAHGISPDGSHTERGWAIPAPVDEVRTLAARFLQDAIFWFDGKVFSILPVLAPHQPLQLPVPS
ncbi:MAG TPA: DUF3293 domain-containing protein [Gemmatimonadales bacterium]|nr:DUF3293 domain-containing protein [Gemmatimonadales bacterium]